MTTSRYSAFQFLLARTLLGLVLMLYPLVRTTHGSISEFVALDLLIVLLGFLCAIGRSIQIVSVCLVASLMLHVFICNPSPLLFLFSSVTIFLATIFSVVDQSRLPFIPDTGEQSWNLLPKDLKLIAFFHKMALALFALFLIWERIGYPVDYSPLAPLIAPYAALYHPTLSVGFASLIAITLLCSIPHSTQKLCWWIQTILFSILFLAHGFALFFMSLLIFQLLVFRRAWAPADSLTSGIIFFDGHCVLCSGWVNFVMREDYENKYKFATLQGETAKKELPEQYRVKLDSIAVKIENDTYQRSTAVIQILIGLGGIWKTAAIFWLIPKALRDVGYNFIASIRYRTFGKTEVCRVPLPEEKERLLP